MKNLQKLIFFSCSIALLLMLLTACGRYSEPSPIEGSGYPHNYPHSQGGRNG